MSTVNTGEENEETIHQVRGKLYVLVDGKTWKERGTGILRLNVRREDGLRARLGEYSLSLLLLSLSPISLCFIMCPNS